MNTRALPLVVTLLALLSSASGQQSSTLVLTQTIPLPGISGAFNHHSADGKHHRLFLCASANQTVEIVDLEGGNVVRSLRGAKPSATCFASDLNVLCVSCSKTLQLYDATSFELLASLAMPSSVDELHYDSRGKQVVAGCMTAPNEGIATVDLVARRVLSEIKSSHPQGFALETGSDRVFVCTPRTGRVTVVDRTKGAATAEWKLANAVGDYAVEFDSATHRLFVGCRQPAKLVVIDTDTGKAVAEVDIGRDTDDLSFDAANKRIYVACGEGVISVVQQDNPDHYRNVATIPTAAGARNCVFLPETGQFCVTVPQDGDQPAAVLVYQTQPRKR